MTEKSDVHIEYGFDAERPLPETSPFGNQCADEFSGRVHTKKDAEDVVEFLRSRGYNVKLSRKTMTVVENDPFQGEKPE